jgi:hypothetical protein
MTIEENILSKLKNFYSDNDDINSAVSEDDFESDMAISQLKSIVKNAYMIHQMIQGREDLPSWIQSKLTKASDYMTSVNDYLDGEKGI